MRSSSKSALGRAFAPLLVGVLATSACQQPPPTPPPEPPSVGVARPERRDITLFGEYTGTTRAYQSVEIRARVEGALEEMRFEPGRVVQQGSTLFVIEPRPYKAARDSAFAALKSAEADLARTESDLQRVEQAVKTNAVSRSDVDLARAQRDMAQASVLAAKADLDGADLQLSYTEVRSPLTGQVGRNLLDVGNIVGNLDTTVLTTVNQLQPIHIYFDLPEEAVLSGLQNLDQALTAPEELEGEIFVATLADKDFPYQATIDFISNTVNSDTGTIEVRALYENEPLRLFPGLFVRVRIPLGNVADALLVDEKAVGTDLGGRYVYVVGNDNTVEQRYVELGQVQEDGTVYISEGLDGSETYIVEGMLRARPGLPVTMESGS